MVNQPEYPGYLIAIDGIDGAGKTTQSHHVQASLQTLGLEVVRTKEPTTGKWGQILRDSALTGRLSLEDEVETFMKDRREHVETLIMPSLQAGKVVIIDRYYYSTMAYQGARGVDPEKLRQLNEEFAPEPDLLIILDLEPSQGLDRIRARGDRANHFEQTGTLERAREIFLSIQKPYCHVLDARKTVAELLAHILQLFKIVAANKIARIGKADPKGQLNAVLALHGGKPLSD